jgi:hypothetical protein
MRENLLGQDPLAKAKWNNWKENVPSFTCKTNH